MKESNVVQVPDTIDSTGETDAGPALRALLEAQPEHTHIRFRAGGTYRIDTSLGLADRHNLTLEGNGATVVSDLALTSGEMFDEWDGSDGRVLVREFTLQPKTQPEPGGYFEITDDTIKDVKFENNRLSDRVSDD